MIYICFMDLHQDPNRTSNTGIVQVPLLVDNLFLRVWASVKAHHCSGFEQALEQWLLNLGWLMIMVDYTTQYIGDYNYPIEVSL